MHPVCGLNPCLLAVFRNALIIYGLISVVTWQQMLLPVSTAALWFMAIQVWLIFYVACCKELCFHLKIVCLEGLLGRIIAGICHATGSLSSLFLEVRVSSTDNNQLFNGVIACVTHGSVHLTCRRKRLDVAYISAGLTGHCGHPAHCMRSMSVF